jgi:Domain of unknown function (DUF4911)
MTWSPHPLDEHTFFYPIVAKPDAIVLLSAIVESYEGLIGAVHSLDPERALVALFVTEDTKDTAKELLISLPWLTPVLHEEISRLYSLGLSDLLLAEALP